MTIFYLVIVFICGIITGACGVMLVFSGYREHFIKVRQELAEDLAEFDKKREEFEKDWSNGARTSKRRFKLDEK